MKIAQELKYNQQKKEILENVDKAVEMGIQNFKKRKAAEMEKKKQEEKEAMKKMWGDIDLSSDEESESNNENSPLSEEKENTASGQDEQSNNTNSAEDTNERANKRQKISDSQFVHIHSNTNAPSEQIDAPTANPEPSQTQELDLTKYETAEQLESLGLEILKTELQRRGLLCGGTLKDRASRLLAVRGKTRAQIDPKLFAKGAGAGAVGAKKKK